MFDLSKLKKIGITRLHGEVLEEGFKVFVTAKEETTNQEIGEFLYNNASFFYLCGMNKKVGKDVVVVNCISGQKIEVCFNREYEK